MKNITKDFASNLLKAADIKINGSRPWDVKIYQDKLYNRILRQGSIGLGESYVDGWWEAERLDEFFHRALRAKLDRAVKIKRDWKALLFIVGQVLINHQTKSGSQIVGEQHYDLGNDLFEAMLDKRMVYTCGYWKNADNLDQAQEDKLDLVCKKLQLKPGQSILDIGCGWGSFAKFAAERYGASVTGITISKEQVTLGNKLCAGLPVKIINQDYREIQGRFDHIVSLGMFEHVGYKNYRTYMKMVHKHLKDDGLFLLHTIGSLKTVKINEAWIDKYIFPNAMLPSIAQIGKSLEGLFVMEDWHNFGADYDKTLMAWLENFEKAWPQLEPIYGQRFYRMWKFFLAACAGGFRARKMQLWQIILSKNGVANGYTSFR
ncbi:MAG: Cyclopropane-fatty-acyl-phospholipid synthase [Parcubacteria group bacterium GW2011_GWE2_39_37]|uniref:Cyclopropane-fatty-acyl-phospholipid synthase n=1 Tax=Candidatus Falkowbacteria bacterium GW2011_GWF2_39_8 TaxID=1618642 RepID=A0A0G0SDX4_9BACT|nr:MAG: Cyclopropane-fatty-acyl-phospholipid synthase [Parcubacteria group bacterium GW2011_GWE2_39_37]KKR32910.1 MAG: Cyclopropane-fatty-acyl-phospholipid synthase [Candidatus Falkowbacteria bacterium GW2011_GWF2_39_8]